MNRYFLSLTLVQGAVIGLSVTMAVRAFTALAALAAGTLGLAAACVFVAVTVVAVAGERDRENGADRRPE